MARDAGPLALSHFETLATVPVEAKGHLDLVTAADQEVEHFVMQRLARDFLNGGIFGEEGASHQGTSGRIWVIDLIDGTFNFVRRGDQWAVSIGLYQGGAAQLWGDPRPPSAIKPWWGAWHGKHVERGRNGPPCQA